MKKQFLAVLGVGAVVLGLAAGAVWAASKGVEIPFSFTVNGKEMAAGSYEVRTEGPDLSRLTLRNIAGGDTIFVSYFTRLADMGGANAQVVFDVADEKHYLSEVHVPGIDGFALQGAPGKHTHAKVTAKE